MVACLLSILVISVALLPSSSSFVANNHAAALSPRTIRQDASIMAGVGFRIRDRRFRSSQTTQVHMMFDQLSSALTEVAKKFGGKQR